MTKILFITGGARGLGLDIAKSALAAGDAVIATGRDPVEPQALRPSRGRPPPTPRSKDSAELMFWRTAQATSTPASSRNSAPARFAIRSRRYCSAR